MATAASAKFQKSSGELGDNIKYALDDKGILTLTVDLTKRLGPSASGKTIIVGSTKGNAAVPGGNGVVIGFNAYTKA